MACTRRALIAGVAAATAQVAAGDALAQAPQLPQPSAPPAGRTPRRLGPAVVGPPATVEVVSRQLAKFGRTTVNGGAGSRLEFVGGLVMTSQTKSFGGWSGLVMSEDGRRLLAVSDGGDWMTAELVYEAGKPQALASVMIGEIAGLGGAALRRGRDKDAESVALLDGTLARGTVLISFERNHRIGRFPISERGLGPPLGYLRMPADARRIPFNRGIEAVAVLRVGPMKGAVLAFAEEMPDAQRNHTGWIWPGSIGGEPQRLGLVNHDDFAVTDLAVLPDGNLLVLERKFRWLEGVRCRIRLVRGADIKPGALLDGELLLDADMSSDIDNMEGLAVSRNQRGQTVLTIISDNNYNNLLQRNLLLQFVLLDRGPRGASRT